MTSRYQYLDEGVYDFQTSMQVLPKHKEAWDEYLVWLTAGGVPLPADSLGGNQTLEDAKNQRVAEIDAYASAIRNRIVAGISAGEMASWILKLLDAFAVKTGTTSPFVSMLPTLGTALGLPVTPTSINEALGTIRGITAEAHADKVIASALQLLIAETAIDPVRGKHCDAIRAMTDVRDIIGYNWRTGWPSL